MSWIEKYQNVQTRLTRVNWYFCCGLFTLFLVIAGLIYTSWKLNYLVNDADQLPIDSVILKGIRTHTTDKDIQVALQGLLNRSFFSADVAEVQTTLEALPWIYRASVQREWPSKLKVYVQEQDVVASWNNSEWLNRSGEVFDAPASQLEQGLPALSGPEDKAKEVLRTYQQVGGLLKINGFNLAKLSLSLRHAWHVELSNQIKLDLGREDTMTRVQRFIDVYPQLQQQDKKIAYIDLRYDTGLAVGWAQTEVRVGNE
ncbi:MAG: cell division protein FtsQ/DivIB [Parashewanella sp.]